MLVNIFIWLSFNSTLNTTQMLNKLQSASAKCAVSLDINAVAEHTDPSLDWICFIKMNNGSLRSPDNMQASPPFTLEAAQCAPYGAIPYCIMQQCNRLSYMLLCRRGVLGWLWWLTSLSLPSSELFSCWGVSFPLPHINTDLGCPLQWRK